MILLLIHDFTALATTLAKDEPPSCAILAAMDILKMLAELRGEREHIEEAIIVLERLARGRGKRRGRPPAWMSAAKDGATKRRGRPPGSKNKPKPDSGA
jgi:hypothetical protein